MRRRIVKVRWPQRKPFLLAALTGPLLLAGGLGQLRAAVPHVPTETPEAVPANLLEELDKFWQNARKETYKSVPELLAKNRVEIDRGIRFHKLIRGNPSRKRIAITFDDGPHPAYTPRLLSILKEYHAKATFFVVGEVAEQHPELVRAEIADGHNVGNHTYHHVNLTKIPEDYVATEIKACGEVLAQITGKRPHLFRPPGGDYNHNVASVAEALGYTMVLWTDDPGDYAHPSKELLKARLLSKATNGGIILIHDGIEETIDVLPGILQYLSAQGYEFVTVDELMRDTPDRL